MSRKIHPARVTALRMSLDVPLGVRKLRGSRDRVGTTPPRWTSVCTRVSVGQRPSTRSAPPPNRPVVGVGRVKNLLLLCPSLDPTRRRLTRSRPRVTGDGVSRTGHRGHVQPHGDGRGDGAGVDRVSGHYGVTGASVESPWKGDSVYRESETRTDNYRVETKWELEIMD